MANMYRGSGETYFQVPNRLIEDGILHNMSLCEIKVLLGIHYKMQRNSVVEVVSSDDEIARMTGLSLGSIKKGRDELTRLGVVRPTRHARGHRYAVCNLANGKLMVNYNGGSAGTGFDITKASREQYKAYFDYHLAAGNPSENKNRLNACCPFHSDNSPSLSVSLTTGQWNCRGCQRKGGVFGFEVEMAHIGGEKIDHSEGRRRVMRILRAAGLLAESADTQPDEIYPYVNADGELLFEMCRFGSGKGKTFRARRPHPFKDGQHVWDMDGVEPVLYALPEVLDANYVIIVEGEKDANKLRQLRLHDPDGKLVAATTNPFGAGNWKEEYSAGLLGLNVVIIPDTDEKGLAHGERVRSSLKETCDLDARVVQIPAGHGKDVSEYLEKHTREELIKLIGADWFDSEHPFGVQI